MNAPIDRKAALVAELQNRLAEAISEEDQDLLSDALTSEAADLETLCIRALREAALADEFAKGIDAVIEAAKARKDRLKSKREKLRQAVADAMAEAGIPKITAPDMTVSFRMGNAPLIIDREPTEGDVSVGIAKAKVTYSWDKDAVRKWMETVPFTVARLGNPQPVLTVRSK